MPKTLNEKQQEVLENCMLDLQQQIDIVRRRLRSYGLKSHMDTKESGQNHKITICIDPI
jgi:hypothetical protein